jgi:hypothetical protein
MGKARAGIVPLEFNYFLLKNPPLRWRFAFVVQVFLITTVFSVVQSFPLRPVFLALDFLGVLRVSVVQSFPLRPVLFSP